MYHKRIFIATIALLLSNFWCLFAQQAPFPLPGNTIFEYPFNMVGKVFTPDDRFGSGTAISQKVVLTAGHVFFDNGIIDWKKGQYGWNRQHAPDNRFSRIYSRSYRFFTDYAEATRRFQPDELDLYSFEQFNNDVICLIFFEDVANGGWAGWVSNQITNNNLKMIVGYPNLNYANSDTRNHRMHSTSIEGSSANFELVDYVDRLNVTKRVYLSEDLTGGRGNSGGPIYELIKFSDNTIDWGVVGIYVGGTVDDDGGLSINTFAVGIDEAVSNLIKNAEADTTNGQSDDHGDTRGTATTVELNSSISGNIETEDDIDYFSFEINRVGTVTVLTTGNTDTLGTLKNASGNTIVTNDDGGSSSNFSITRELSPGTYYIEVSHYSNEETGTYTLHVDFTETIRLPDLVVDSVSVASTTVMAGQKVRVDFHRSNSGSEDSVAFSQGLYLSENETITTLDTLLVDFAKQEMNAGTSDSLFFEVTIPENTTPGTYYIGYILDSDRLIEEIDETNNSGFIQITITSSGSGSNNINPPDIELMLDGSGDIAGENIRHPNGNTFDQVLLTGPTIQLQAKPGQITRVSFMDETEDIVQVEFSGTGSFTVTLDPATFLPPAIPPRYNQAVEYVTGKPSVVIDGADSSTFFSIFTVGRINAVNQALFPAGQVYDAVADVTLVKVINSTGIGGIQLSNVVFSGSTGKVGVDARGIPISVRLTIGDIDASGTAVPYILFGDGSFTVPAGNPGLRITGGDLLQTNGSPIIVAEGGSTTPGFDTMITQNNFKSDNTPQPTQSIDATFTNEAGDAITVTTEELTIE